MVVTIIVILAGMLMPSLQRARESARKAVCTNNLKQIGLAFYMYFQDHDEYFPKRITPDGTEWPTTLNSYVPQPVSGKRGHVYHCPSNRVSPKPWSCYAYNKQFTESTSVFWYSLRSVKRNPGKLVLVSDGGKKGQPDCGGMNNEFSMMWDTTYGYDYDRIWYWHNDGANILFLDGHVEWKRRNEIFPCDPQALYDASNTMYPFGVGGSKAGLHIWWDPSSTTY